MVDITGTNISIIGIGSDLLGSYYNARTVTTTVNAIRNSPSRIENGPVVTTPWALQESRGERTLAAEFNAVRGKTEFINLNDSSITQTRNKDEKALFALYQALNDLKVIANYAADANTPTALLANLSQQFKNGLGQVEQYTREAELDKLNLLFGEKKPRAESEVTLGKIDYDIQGSLALSSKTSDIAGLSGTEVFTVNLDKTSVSDDIVIDLSQMTESPTLQNISSFINQQIISYKTTNADGEEISKYQSRFLVSEDSNGKFSLGIDGVGGEKVTLSASATEPALYITGTHKDVGSDKIETGTITKINGLDNAGPTTVFNQTAAGIDLNNVLPPLTDDDGNEIITEPDPLETRTSGSAVDSQGNLFVVGTSEGDLGGQLNQAEQDVFLSKYSSTGTLLWSRLLGASDQAEAFDVAIDSSDNVVIAGQVNGELSASDTFSGLDSFVTKYDSAGKELWTYQQDTLATDQANSLAIDGNGDIIVGGTISGRLNSGTTAGGLNDIFVTRLDGTNGTVSDSTQIGGTGQEFGNAVTVASDGNILIASREGSQAIIRKLDATDLTNVISTYDLGDLAGGVISDITVDENGDVFVAGSAYASSLTGGTVSNAHSGGADGFITKLSDNGSSLSADWTHYLGSSGAERIDNLTVSGGSVYVAGQTNGTLPGARKTGTTDGFAAKIDSTTGGADWIRQFGGAAGYNGSTSLAFSATGSSVLDKLGLPSGTYNNRQAYDIETQTTARAGDYFYVKVDGRPQKKIIIEAGDDFKDLALKIQRVSFRDIKAVATIAPTSTDSSTTTPAATFAGPKLKIESINGATIDIIAGKGSQDALAKLGMESTKILPSEKIFAIGEEVVGTDPDNLGGVFALDLLAGYSLRSKKEAEYVSNQITTALETIERAYRSLTYDPVKADLLKQAELKKGTVSPYQTKQLANYSEGLSRISALTGLSSSLLA